MNNNSVDMFGEIREIAQRYRVEKYRNCLLLC